jgi:hypothetical protein
MGGGTNGGRILGEQVKIDLAKSFSKPGLSRPDRLSCDVRMAVPARVSAESRERSTDFAGVHPAELGLV